MMGKAGDDVVAAAAADQPVHATSGAELFVAGDVILIVTMLAGSTVTRFAESEMPPKMNLKPSTRFLNQEKNDGAIQRIKD